MKGDKNLLQCIKTGYYNDLEEDNFNLFGLKVYLGSMGSGKTLSMIRETYDLVQQHENIAVISNVKLNFKCKYYYYFDNIQDFFKIYINCIKFDKPDGVVVLMDEIQLIIEKLIQTKNIRLLTILSQCRKLHTYIIGTSQLYSKIDSDIRSYIRINGQLVFCNRFLKYITIQRFVNMSTCVEDSRIHLNYTIRKFDWFVHTRDLFDFYNTFDIVSPILDLVNLN